MIEVTNYAKYRGKCKEFSEQLVRDDPTLTLVRGYYYCFAWGEQPHWWCKKPNGDIVDPTKDQFPSKGDGEYVEFNGFVTCDVCGDEFPEENFYLLGKHNCCSYKCYGFMVMG